MNISTQSIVFQKFGELIPELQAKVMESSCPEERCFAPNLALTCKLNFDIFNTHVVHVAGKDNLQALLQKPKEVAEFRYVHIRNLLIGYGRYKVNTPEQVMLFLGALNKVIALKINYDLLGYLNAFSFPKLEVVYSESDEQHSLWDPFQPQLSPLEIADPKMYLEWPIHVEHENGINFDENPREEPDIFSHLVFDLEF